VKATTNVGQATHGKNNLEAGVQRTSKPASRIQARRQKPLDITSGSSEEFILNDWWSSCQWNAVWWLLLSACSFHNIEGQRQDVFSLSMAVDLGAC